MISEQLKEETKKCIIKMIKNTNHLVNIDNSIKNNEDVLKELTINDLLEIEAAYKKRYKELS